MTTLLNRADLLACIKHYDASQIDNFVAILGYAVTEHLETAKVIELVGTMTSNVTMTGSLTVTPSKTQARFLLVVAHRRFNEDAIVVNEPEWYRRAPP